jgi:hypothetical protein
MDLDVAGEKAARLAKLVTDVIWWVGLAAFVVFAVLFVTAPLLQGAGFGVHLVRSFLADVLATDVFTTRNAKRLSNLGWLVIALCIAGPQLEHLRAWWILKSTPLSGGSLSPASSDYGGLWLVGVLTLVLAAAWRYGAALQQERDLTV